MGSWPAGRDWPSGYEQKRCRDVVTNSNRRQEISKDWSASLVLSNFYAKLFEHSRGSRNKPWEILPQENYSTMFLANFWDGSKSLQNYQNIFYGQIPQKKLSKIHGKRLEANPLFYVPVSFPNGRLILPKCHQTGVLLGKLHLSLGIVAFLPFVQKQNPIFIFAKFIIGPNRNSISIVSSLNPRSYPQKPLPKPCIKRNFMIDP